MMAISSRRQVLPVLVIGLVIGAVGLKVARYNGSSLLQGTGAMARIGAVMAASGRHNWSELSRKADIALYGAKATGRNRMVIYEETMDEDVQGRHLIEAELREALRADDGQLWLAFQPLYGGADLRLHGAEALVRWTHPRLGLVSPARFIPIAESAGLIEPLGRLVFREACATRRSKIQSTFQASWSSPKRRACMDDLKDPTRGFQLLVERRPTLSTKGGD